MVVYYARKKDVNQRPFYVSFKFDFSVRLKEKLPSRRFFVKNEKRHSRIKRGFNHYIKTSIKKVLIKKRKGAIQMTSSKKKEHESLEKVKRDGMALESVADQTNEVCLAAVKQNGKALQFVKEQTEEICLTAVQQNAYALEYAKDQTEAICLEAVKKDGYALASVKKQTETICLEAVKQEGWALECVEKQTHKICLEAIKNNVVASDYIVNKEEEMFLMALMHGHIPLFLTKDYVSYLTEKPTKEMEQLCLMILQKRFLHPIPYQLFRFQLKVGKIQKEDSPYHVLECLYR